MYHYYIVSKECHIFRRCFSLRQLRKNEGILELKLLNIWRQLASCLNSMLTKPRRQTSILPACGCCYLAPSTPVPGSNTELHSQGTQMCLCVCMSQYFFSSPGGSVKKKKPCAHIPSAVQLVEASCTSASFFFSFSDR